MDDDIRFELDRETAEKLHAFGELLKKDHNTMLEEALQLYFDTQEKILQENGVSKKDSMTNLSFDEFWDDIDV